MLQRRAWPLRRIRAVSTAERDKTYGIRAYPFVRPEPGGLSRALARHFSSRAEVPKGRPDHPLDGTSTDWGLHKAQNLNSYDLKLASAAATSPKTIKSRGICRGTRVTWLCCGSERRSPAYRGYCHAGNLL